jgi:hypothetical protein
MTAVEPAAEVAGAVVRLDRLASALGSAGYWCETRYLAVPSLLRVRHPALPVLGESVAAVPGPGAFGTRVWWFRSSSGAFIAQCGDLRRAVEVIAGLLAPWVEAFSAETAP